MMPTPNLPEFLKAGDLATLVCPASFVTGELEDAGQLLQSWGLRVKKGETVQTRLNQYSGSDERRTADLQSALDDPEVKVVFAARGGYGTVRIIDRVDFTKFLQKPKWLVGFSDITVLHSHIHAVYGIPTIHGQMPVTIPEGTTSSLETLRKALFGEKVDYIYDTAPTLAPSNRDGRGKGKLIGGNLALLHSLTGSRSEMDFEGKILLIEDVGEHYYNVDRMLWTLKRAGKLQGLAGLIVGGFSSMKDLEVPFGSTVEEIILEKINGHAFPVAFDFPAGHIPNNHALMLGREVTLSVQGASVKLKYTDSNGG